MAIRPCALDAAFVPLQGSYIESRPALLNERRIGEEGNLVPVVFIYAGCGMQVVSESQILKALDERSGFHPEIAAAYDHALILLETMEKYPGNFPVIQDSKNMYKHVEALDPLNRPRPENKPALETAPKHSEDRDRVRPPFPEKPNFKV